MSQFEIEHNFVANACKNLLYYRNFLSRLALQRICLQLLVVHGFCVCHANAAFTLIKTLHGGPMVLIHGRIEGDLMTQNRCDFEENGYDFDAIWMFSERYLQNSISESLFKILESNTENHKPEKSKFEGSETMA